MSDLIDRRAAIDALNKRAKETFTLAGWYSYYLGALHDVADDIKQIPSAQQDRKRGRWISRDGEEDCCECSECHAVIEGDEVYWRNNYFCYHCGADMRGGEDA